MLKKFIQRPVLSTVISVIIILLGVLGLVKLPVAQYPTFSPPTVQVSATYSGANADVVLKSVIIPLEQQINGVEGMTYMTSTANNQGFCQYQRLFCRGHQTRTLPRECAKSGIGSHQPLAPVRYTKTASR